MSLLKIVISMRIIVWLQLGGWATGKGSGRYIVCKAGYSVLIRIRREAIYHPEPWWFLVRSNWNVSDKNASYSGLPEGKLFNMQQAD